MNGWIGRGRKTNTVGLFVLWGGRFDGLTCLVGSAAGQMKTRGRKVEKRKRRVLSSSSYLSTAPGSRWGPYMYLILPYSRWVSGLRWEYIHIKQVRLVCRQVRTHMELVGFGFSNHQIHIFSKQSSNQTNKQTKLRFDYIYTIPVISFFGVCKFSPSILSILSLRLSFHAERGTNE